MPYPPDALLATQTLEHDPDLLLGSELPAGPTTDLPYRCFGRLLFLVRHLETLVGGLAPIKCLLATGL